MKGREGGGILREEEVEREKYEDETMDSEFKEKKERREKRRKSLYCKERIQVRESKRG